MIISSNHIIQPTFHINPPTQTFEVWSLRTPDLGTWPSSAVDLNHWSVGSCKSLKAFLLNDLQKRIDLTNIHVSRRGAKNYSNQALTWVVFIKIPTKATSGLTKLVLRQSQGLLSQPSPSQIQIPAARCSATRRPFDTKASSCNWVVMGHFRPSPSFLGVSWSLTLGPDPNTKVQFLVTKKLEGVDSAFDQQKFTIE